MNVNRRSITYSLSGLCTSITIQCGLQKTLTSNTYKKNQSAWLIRLQKSLHQSPLKLTHGYNLPACSPQQHVASNGNAFSQNPHIYQIYIYQPYTNNKMFDPMKTRISVHDKIDTRGKNNDRHTLKHSNPLQWHLIACNLCVIYHSDLSFSKHIVLDATLLTFPFIHTSLWLVL